MSGILYIVATPIGNLDDITYRAVRLLKEVDLIAAEDTRHSLKLLNHLGISKKIISLHEHNEVERVATILAHLQEGKDIALVSDAGTPLISDPGYHLVVAARKQGIDVSPIPGVSSIIAALSCAGLPTNEFLYIGFLSQKKQQRLNKLNSLKNSTRTIVLLESTHRIISLLEQINASLAQAQIVIAKELTKVYERFISGTAIECLAVFKADERLVKGEFVVMLHQKIANDRDANEKKTEKILLSLLQEMPLKKAVSLAVELTQQNKNTLYQLALKLNNKARHTQSTTVEN